MSTQNITAQGYTDEGYYVVFETHRGDSRAYLYPASVGAQIEAGADPSSFQGQEIPVPSGS
jgi:hypothetical protein